MGRLNLVTRQFLGGLGMGITFKLTESFCKRIEGSTKPYFYNIFYMSNLIKNWFRDSHKNAPLKFFNPEITCFSPCQYVSC